jgi:mRNA-degrading endonuclease RelE of RelBE toxin-antitoxin system
LIDGTPILDIKPYLPEYDSLPQAVTPQWILHTPSQFNSIHWSDTAFSQLESHLDHLEFYHNSKELKETIDQIVKLDIRSVNQKNLHKERSGNYKFRIDKLLVGFEFLGEKCTVISVDIYTP